MPSPEQIAHQSFELYAPVDKTGGGFGGATGPEKIYQLDKKYLTSQVREIQKDNISRAHFELFELEATGLLSTLEEAGIVPRIPDNPNPIDPEINEKQHEQWWKQHPKDEKIFNKSIEERETIISYLYLGASLGRFLDNQTSQRRL